MTGKSNLLLTKHSIEYVQLMISIQWVFDKSRKEGKEKNHVICGINHMNFCMSGYSRMVSERFLLFLFSSLSIYDYDYCCECTIHINNTTFPFTLLSFDSYINSTERKIGICWSLHFSLFVHLLHISIP